jgi:hypothetical protein
MLDLGFSHSKDELAAEARSEEAIGEGVQS